MYIHTMQEINILQCIHKHEIGHVLHLLLKKRTSLTIAPILCVNRFSPDLVHRHVIVSVTLLLLVLLMIITPDSTQ